MVHSGRKKMCFYRVWKWCLKSMKEPWTKTSLLILQTHHWTSKEGTAGNYIGHFCFLWWKLQGVSGTCTAWDQWSGCRSGLHRCLGPAEYGWWGGLLPLLSPDPCPGQFSHLCPFTTTKILLGVWSISKCLKAIWCFPQAGLLGGLYFSILIHLFCSANGVKHVTLPSPLPSFSISLK